MKNYLLIILTLIIFSCSTDDSKPKDETELVGKWKLIEQYLDPGDGSGAFQPVNSKRVIQFFKDGTVEINGELCVMSSELGDKESGSYTLITDSDTQYDGEIIPNNCSSRSARVYFDLPLSGNLILWYQCIEGCGQKFTKI